jgi:hypothetical protein
MVLDLLDDLKDFVNFALIDALDVGELLLGSHHDAGNGAKPIGLEFGNVRSINSVLLQLLNLIEVGLFQLCLLKLLLFLHLHLLLLLRLLSLLLHTA